MIFFPHEIAEKRLSKAKIKKLINDDLTLNLEAIRSVSNENELIYKELKSSVKSVLDTYKERYKDFLQDETKKKAMALAINGDKLLIQRVRAIITFSIAQDIKERFKGKKYKWLPSSANIPDVRHQLKYGKTFVIGVGEMPQDRYGCQCGMDVEE